MARPGSEIIASTQVDDYLGIDILKSLGQWVVVYKQQPINLRQRYWGVRGEKPKYLRTSYSNPAPAENLAAKLNREFYTTDFTVKKVI
jgi:hypothetical protein